MTQQIGRSDAETELALIAYRGDEVAPIALEEYGARLHRARQQMAEQDIDVLLLTASSNLSYFTGVDWHPSERFFGALIFRDRPTLYVVPAFEAPRLAAMLAEEAPMLLWEEGADPYALVRDALTEVALARGAIALDEQAPYFVADHLARQLNGATLHPATPITAVCRMCKSPSEIAIIRHAMALTLVVQRHAARILRAGISASEVVAFIDTAHRKIAGHPSTFCIVSFGEATAYPHGGGAGQSLQEGDMVLIDTGTCLHGYHSDITRSYVFGVPSERQRTIWAIEKEAQAAAFAAARPGVPCEAVDQAARQVLEAHGLGPGYAVPGLPHRTGHGLGLDIHEHPYLVEGNRTPLAPGMCFSNEPMICIYGEFGVRLEDHFYMTAEGPCWFTEPAKALDAPFP
ncbi:M24 family metallopeptidase [Sphingopyxis sp. MWB1]|uniref:M24 family metallopeptidase n=1 Tax=Sphingopyxis sp. MWB1 TaxID=1537715 RepID=UPI00051A674C|nr:Xaa-Pro peptidase family protein [Sphingopyxis sp. MWB1]